MSDPFAPLRPLLGKTWQATMVTPGEEKPMVDVSRWELVLNGRAVRVLHSVNEGEYGGETIIVWDPVKESLSCFYFTTAGFFTSGTMQWQDGALVSHEQVTGNQNGITEVRATSRILPDGRLHTKAQYRKDGAWVAGHEFFYTENPQVRVVFR